ncbi:MAG: hypothetical protein FJ275_12940 [Planctomycetes bacterium]|nr:hypothetical protein [Planctomycetota bacterium]
MSDLEIIAPPGFTQEEFERMLEDHIARSMFDAIISYLKKTADTMDKCGLRSMTADDLRRVALEMTTQGYEPQ